MNAKTLSNQQIDNFIEWAANQAIQPIEDQENIPEAHMELAWQIAQDFHEVLKLKPGLPQHKLSRLIPQTDIPVVWLQAAADGQQVTIREFSLQDDFGTAFAASVLNDTKSVDQQILRLNIVDENRWEDYEGKKVHVVVGENEHVLVIEAGYAKTRIPVITGKSFIKIHSDLDAD